MNAIFQLGRTPVFWCEHPDDMRRVGYADDILPRSIKHRGWYLQDDGDPSELARGVVFQLPARDGKERFLFGVADPHNDGPAVLAREIANDKNDAARWADHLAEVYAENERDYHRAWSAGARCADIAHEISVMRKAALALLSARGNPQAPDDIVACGVRHVLRDIRKARHERDTLIRDFGTSPGFNDC